MILRKQVSYRNMLLDMFHVLTFEIEFGIVVLDECDKLAKPARQGVFASKDIAGEGVQQALLQMMEGSNITIKRNSGNVSQGKEAFVVNTTNILFVLSGAFVGLEQIIEERIGDRAVCIFLRTLFQSLLLTNCPFLVAWI